MTHEARLGELGLRLPPPAEPKGLYRPAIVVGNLLYTSGHLPIRDDGSIITGRLGADLDDQAGAAAARQVGLSLLSTVRAAVGSLDRVKRLVKLLGVVQCTPEFTRQPVVINGCSQLLADVFGPEHGVGARSAIGTHALPLGACVEIEAVFEIVF